MNADARKVMRRQAALSVESMGENARALLFSAHVLEALDEIDRLEAKIAKLIEAGDAMADLLAELLRLAIEVVDTKAAWPAFKALRTFLSKQED